MNKQVIEEVLEKWIRKACDVEEYDVEMDMMDDLGLSSLDLMQMLSLCESEFGVRLTGRDLRRISTPDDMAEIILDKMG